VPHVEIYSSEIRHIRSLLDTAITCCEQEPILRHHCSS
jgi:hypothetical protein